MLPNVVPVLGTAIIIVLTLVSRVYVPWAGRSHGAIVRRTPLSLLGRLRMHGVPALVGIALSALALALRVAPALVIAVIPITFALLIALPMSYTLTTEGIMAGRTPMRRWTEFGGVTRRKGGVRLQGVAGARGMTVWLSGSRDDDEMVLLLRQLVRGAYQGGVGPELSAADRDSLPAGRAAAALDQVRAAGG
jgi:hypothetical protein